MKLPDVAVRFASNSITFVSDYCLSHCTPHPFPLIVTRRITFPFPERPTKGRKINVTMISAVAMKLLSRKAGTQPIALFLYEINQAIKVKTSKEEWRKQIPHKYNEFLDLFDK